MEEKEKEQQTNEEKDWQWGCFEPSSKIGRIMMKMMKKMCGSMSKETFNCDSMMRGVKWYKESNEGLILIITQ